MAAQAPAIHERHVPENINKKHKQALGMQDRIALVITTAIGTMYAVYFFAIFMAGWMLWQGVIAHHAFDPFPFAFLLFLGNIVQLLLMPLIMVGQNIQGRHAEIQSDEEYKTTMTSYKDIEHILLHLDSQDQEMLRQTKLLNDLLAREARLREAVIK
jgi:uncharacterized membrane protein